MGVMWLQLVIAGLLPVLFSWGFSMLEKKTAFGRMHNAEKQIIIGLCFGGLAVLFTECGIDVGDAVINVRNAAPLSAGLLFGWPAGIIAGLIGGVERWLAASWGIGEFTKVACSVATVAAGFLGAAVRKFIAENQRTSWLYGLFLGVISEVLHMLLVFMTNTGEITRSFEIVSICAIPMVAANGLSVMFSVIAASLVNRERVEKQGLLKIAQKFQRSLLICVLVAFVATTVLTFYYQSRSADVVTEVTLRTNVEDVKNSIRDASDQNLLELTYQVADEVKDMLERGKTITPTDLRVLADEHNVTEINLVDKTADIICSTYDDFIGFSMGSGQQSAAFLPLLHGEQEIVQDYQPTTYDRDICRKYAGIALEEVGFVQVGYGITRFQQDIKGEVIYAARNRHIDQTGFIVICDGQGMIVSDRDGHEGESVEAFGGILDRKLKRNTLIEADIYGTPSYCLYQEAEGYYIIGVLPKAEALFARDVAVYMLAFVEVLVFAVLFAHVFFLIKKQIVRKIERVNATLSEITKGNLDVRVDVRDSREFDSLSEDINSTVETLKHYIQEAEARIDKELEFAKKIQHSSLPSVFPPYPNRKDFSIYAYMDTAKEVGGDFYDFYLLNEKQLAILIADVSGKGIPASLFMMTAKTLIKGLAEGGMEVHDVFTHANEKLCENNEAGMFVTAWMGIVDLETGLVTYANAGHNPPVIKRKNGSYEYLKSRKNFVLAGMDGIRYRKQELQLNSGDAIYLYTDGVTEAQNMEQELFGEPRLLDTLNEKPDMTVEETCMKVMEDVDRFVGEADQFDDITMLCVQLNIPETAELTVVPTIETVPQVAAFVEEQMMLLGAPIKTVHKMNIAVDEIFSNIVRYSGATRADTICRKEANAMTLIFRDDGVPCNPLDAKEPDITLSAEQRAIGGLGIYMVRKMMDRVEYMHKDDMNILSMTITW